MTAEALVLFMKRVEINGTTKCWEWIGPIANSGYGRTYTNGRVQSAHRASYEHFIGDIVQGNQVDHMCSIKHCVNPKHLQQVDRATNMTLATERKECFNSNITHCPHGHPYDKRNTCYQKVGTSIHRKCRTCARERIRIRRESK